MKNTSHKLRSLSTAIVFVFVLQLMTLPKVHAADLLNRSLQLSSSFPSENVSHTYNFTTATASNIGSIQFQYCSNSPLFVEPCTAPAGLNVMSAAIASQTGITGFSVSGVSTANNLVITRAPAAQALTLASFVFSNIINPSTSDEVDYVRITVFDGSNATGATIDTGAVAFVVDNRYDVEAYVPPYLTFCAAVSVALDCSTVSGFLGDFGEFSPSTAATVTSQMSAATNDPSGYNIFINGQTLLSGSNVIPAMSTQTTSQPGQSQFGINLRANSSPSVGSNPEAGLVASGTPTSNYNTPNQFRFVNGDAVASSPISSGFNRYTVSYIVNVSELQSPGVYASTFTYTAITTF